METGECEVCGEYATLKVFQFGVQMLCDEHYYEMLEQAYEILDYAEDGGDE